MSQIVNRREFEEFEDLVEETSKHAPHEDPEGEEEFTTTSKGEDYTMLSEEMVPQGNRGYYGPHDTLPVRSGCMMFI